MGTLLDRDGEPVIALLLALSAHAGETWLVRSGETAEEIARAAGVSPAALRGLNGLEPGEDPEPGDVVRIPSRPGRTVDIPAALSAIEGEGTARIGTAPPVQVEVGMDLPVGTEVCTGPGSYATIRLAYDPVTLRHDDVQLLPETCIVIASTAGGRGMRRSIVQVDRGSVSFRVVEDDPGAVTVITPTGVTAGERGGFRVSIEDDASRTEALYEQVVVISADQELVVDQGYGTRAQRDEAPLPPVKLLGPCTPQAPEAGYPLRRPEFAWKPIDRALGYRVEFASDAEFAHLVLVEESDGALWTPDVLFLPFRVPGLWWRVVAFDRTGFGGLPSEGRYLAFPAGVGP